MHRAMNNIKYNSASICNVIYASVNLTFGHKNFANLFNVFRN